MSAYLDTSVLAAYYLPEPLSERVEAALVRIDAPCISRLVDVEFGSILARKVRMKEISRASAREVLADYEADKAAGRYRIAVVEVSHYIQAQRWIESFDVPLRTLDALHLAIAHTESVPVLTADRQVARAAGQLGIRTRLLSA